MLDCNEPSSKTMHSWRSFNLLASTSGLCIDFDKTLVNLSSLSGIFILTKHNSHLFGNRDTAYSTDSTQVQHLYEAELSGLPYDPSLLHWN